MTIPPATTEPPKRKGLGCFGVVAIVVVGLIITFLVFAFTRPTDEQKVARCPEVTRDLVESRLGTASSFTITENNPGNSMEGTAVVGGVSYWWGCGIGITRGDRVQVDVRDPDNNSVFLEYVDL